MLLFHGVATVVGIPLAGMQFCIVSTFNHSVNIFFCDVNMAGLLFDIFGDYHITFYFAGSSILLSAFICYPLGRINRWEKLHNLIN